MTSGEAKERVARGAALLDTQAPGWAMLIKTDELNMAIGCACILGQLEGSFHAAVKKLQPWTFRRVRERFASTYGFDVDDHIFKAVRMRDYRVLQDAWIAAIADRLIPQVVVDEPDSATRVEGPLGTVTGDSA